MQCPLCYWKESNDKLSPDYVPTIFMHTVSPLKRKAQVNLERYERRKESKRACPPIDVTEGVTAGDQANLDSGSKNV